MASSSSSSSSSSSRKRSLDDEKQTDNDPQIRQSYVATMRNSSTFVFVSRNVEVSSGDPRLNITPRSLPGPGEDAKQAFIQEFLEHIVDLYREFRRDFPYQHQIEWTMEYGFEKKHTLHITSKKRR